MKKTQLPANTGGHQAIIETNMIDSDMPRLPSRSSMKRANMNLNFTEDTTSVFGETLDIVVSKSGHYAFPLTIPCRIVHKRNNKTFNNTLSVTKVKTKKYPKQRQNCNKTSLSVCPCTK